MEAKKQQNDLLFLANCRWGSDVLTIHELHDRTEHWTTVVTIALSLFFGFFLLNKIGRYSVRASFYTSFPHDSNQLGFK